MVQGTYLRQTRPASSFHIDSCRCLKSFTFASSNRADEAQLIRFLANVLMACDNNPSNEQFESSIIRWNLSRPCWLVTHRDGLVDRGIIKVLTCGVSTSSVSGLTPWANSARLPIIECQLAQIPRAAMDGDIHSTGDKGKGGNQRAEKWRKDLVWWWHARCVFIALREPAITNVRYTHG